jgi:hypothetical protein
VHVRKKDGAADADGEVTPDAQSPPDGSAPPAAEPEKKHRWSRHRQAQAGESAEPPVDEPPGT